MLAPATRSIWETLLVSDSQLLPIQSQPQHLRCEPCMLALSLLLNLIKEYNFFFKFKNQFIGAVRDGDAPDTLQSSKSPSFLSFLFHSFS